MLQNNGIELGVEWINASEDYAVETLISLASIVSPSRRECDRAVFVAERMRSIGLQSVYIDDVFNVIGKIKGQSNGSIVIISMLDDLPETVELQKNGTNYPPHRIEDRVIGPATDIQSSNAAVLIAAEAFIRTGITPKHDLIFAAVSQERTGLTGMKEVFESFKDQALSWIEVLGDGQKIVFGAPFIHWWKIVAQGSLGHTEENWIPNVNQGIARAVDSILALPQPVKYEDTYVNVGMIQSGKTFNYKPEAGWFSLDLRSMTKEIIQEIESDVEQILNRVSQETRIRFDMEKEIILDGGQVPGARDSYIVKLSAEISESLGYSPLITHKGCCNMIVPVSHGLSAVGLHGERGGEDGTVGEWASIPAMMRTAKFVLLLITAHD
jgi:acetylornithine deacetylase/succinyl-diaminopimelate desuccinylase-like protein